MRGIENVEKVFGKGVVQTAFAVVQQEKDDRKKHIYLGCEKQGDQKQIQAACDEIYEAHDERAPAQIITGEPDDRAQVHALEAGNRYEQNKQCEAVEQDIPVGGPHPVNEKNHMRRHSQRHHDAVLWICSQSKLENYSDDEHGETHDIHALDIFYPVAAVKHPFRDEKHKDRGHYPRRHMEPVRHPRNEIM